MALRSGRVGIHPSQVDPITGMLLNGPTPGSMSLSALQDVQITDPEDGAYLTYDSASSKWVNTTTPPAPVVPEGSTVTPTDDIQTWLACAGITDKTYTTLNEVLADSTTLLALMSDNNAVDYLVRSTTWASGVTANSTAMTDIGANNYCANTLLDDATWCTAICNSTYFESVLNAKVPTMTSDTTPSGTCGSTPACNVSYPAFQAFDNNDGTEASLQSANTTALVYYAFTSAVEIKKFKYYVTIGGNPQTTISIKYSDDGSNWTTVDKSFPYTVGDTSEYVIDVVSGKHTYWGLERVTDVAKGSVAKTIQFYGRKDI